ncbi:MAG: molybdopterin molybdotransferase MoeA, partial [Armatimonadetes bacterium]|nr:molybdopterin molybdotransferase MoeA [Akkermansiaceae bacterium]
MEICSVISLTDARECIATQVHSLSSATISLSQASGFVLAEDIFSDADYPSADCSMMDGYVIGKNEVPGTFTFAGEIASGVAPDRFLESGEAMRIFTGALLPSGGGRVLMQEDCFREKDIISVETFSKSLYVRPKGSEAKINDLILLAGTRIGASEMAILAQTGCVYPKVIRKPIIRHLASGDELVAPGEKPELEQIRDTNTSLIAGLLGSMGLGAESSQVADDFSAMKRLAEGNWDLLLISGGASVGDHDHGASTLESMGFVIHFDKINLRPGKPLTFATRDNQIAFVIPGNPVSHFVCFHVAIRLAIELMTGITPSWQFIDLEIVGGEPLRSDPRETFWPAEVSYNAGRIIVTPKRWSTSGDTFSLAGTNALLRIDKSSKLNEIAR